MMQIGSTQGRRNRSAAWLLTGACALAAASLVQAAGMPVGLEATCPPTCDASLDRAASLYDEGRLVEAQRVLQRVLDDGAALRLTPEQATTAARLVRHVNERLREANPVEISLQKAELAVTDKDLVLAE
jgi:hypothetical protein